MPELSDRIKRGQSNNGALYFLCFYLSKNAMTRVTCECFNT